MAKKEISGYVKLQIKGGQANPAPPVGPALGQRGINIMSTNSKQNTEEFIGTSTGLYRSCAALAYFLGTINWNKKKEKLEYYLKEFYYWINLWKGLVWFGLVWFGLIWYGLALFGLVWFGQSTDKQTNKIIIIF